MTKNDSRPVCLPRRGRLVALAAALTAVAVAGIAPSRAGNLTMAVDSMRFGDAPVVEIQYNSGSVHLDEYAYAGPMTTRLNGGPAFDGYCVDLFDDIYLPTSYAVTAKGIGGLGAQGGRIGYLYDTFAPLVTNADQGAALQLAIWDVEYDGGDGLSHGHFQIPVSSSLSAEVSALEAASLGQTGIASWLVALDHTGHRNQNFVGPRTAAAPEPSSMALAALGGLGALGYARRRRV